MFLSYISGYILGRFSHMNGLASLFISVAEYLLSLLYFPLFFLNFLCFLAQKARLVAVMLLQRLRKPSPLPLPLPGEFCL